MEDRNSLKSVLLLAANPKGTVSLRLQEEEREIRERLRLAGYGKTPINSAGAVRPRDIQQAMLDFKPQIVHFTGHGTGQDGLAFEDSAGQVKLIDAAALANLFQLFSDRVECVVLNACYSKFQAEAIAQHIDFVIGMSQAIGDRAAIDFAVGFYTALGAGETIDFAYKMGCNAIHLEGASEYLTPVLLTRKGNTKLHSLTTSLNQGESQVSPQEPDIPNFSKSPKTVENNRNSTGILLPLVRKNHLIVIGIPIVILGGWMANRSMLSPAASESVEESSIVVASQDSAQFTKDEIVGSWLVNEQCLDDKWSISANFSYLSNDTFSSQGSYTGIYEDNNQVTEVGLDLIMTGTWSLMEDRLIMIINDLNLRIVSIKINGQNFDLQQADQGKLKQVNQEMNDYFPSNFPGEFIIEELDETKMTLDAVGEVCPLVYEFVRQS